MSLLDALGLITALLSIGIILWLAAEQAYIDFSWFRRLWARTGRPFPYFSADERRRSRRS